MTLYRPGFNGPSYSKHLRTSKLADKVFSDEMGSTTDWLPVQKGSVISLLMHRATLRRQYDNTNILIEGQYDVVISEDSPVGSAQLEFKLGGEKDNMAAVLGGWKDTIVVFNEPVKMAGFVRVKFNCTAGNYDNEHTGTGGVEVTPVGLFVRLTVQNG